jgi:hypothetical protein
LLWFVKSCRTKSTQILQDLVNNNWVDNKTSVVFVELIFYNANMNRICLFRVFVEVTKAGRAVPDAVLSSMKLYPYSTTEDKYQIFD